MVLRQMCWIVEGGVEAKTSGLVEFIDARENRNGVSCPNCGAESEFWWSDAMSSCVEDQVTLLIANAQCCGAEASLNRPKYVWPVGFAFVHEPVDLTYAAGLMPEQIGELPDALDGPMREIFVHV